MQNQVASLEQTAKDAERTAKLRSDEKVAEQQALEAERASVEKLKAQNDELMEPRRAPQRFQDDAAKQPKPAGFQGALTGAIDLAKELV